MSSNRTIASAEQFAAFLKRKFNFTNLQLVPHTESLRNSVNRFYTANTHDGRKIFIKATADAHLAENEFRANQHLHALDADHFIEGIAYYTKRPYAFSATIFSPGTPLLSYLKNGTLTNADKINIIKNVYEIFCTLRKGDIVHRDLGFHQMLYDQGKIKLVDFQFAVSKSKYKETAFKKFHIMTGRTPKYKRFEWDDTHDLLLEFRTLECPETFSEEFQKMQRDMESYIGKGSVRYKFPHPLRMYAIILGLLIKQYIYKGKKREIYRERLQQCLTLMQEIKKETASTRKTST